jgi:sec-independent protein translocase protein TatB
MFDISWTEFLLIGIVALIVIGPKELPAVMRSLGQWTRKIRSLAADFQNQFQEAMREAEMADLKKQVDDVAHDIKQYDPLKDVRTDVEALGNKLDDDLNKSAKPEVTEQAAQDLATPPDVVPAKELPIPQAAAELRDKEVAGAGVAPVAPEAAAESSTPDGAGRS